jgi:hypothetical protein
MVYANSLEGSSLENFVQPTTAMAGHEIGQSFGSNMEASVMLPNHYVSDESSNTIQPTAEYNMATPQWWPSEICDSMTWSAQFFDIGYNYPTAVSWGGTAKDLEQ